MTSCQLSCHTFFFPSFISVGLTGLVLIRQSRRPCHCFRIYFMTLIGSICSYISGYSRVVTAECKVLCYTFVIHKYGADWLDVLLRQWTTFNGYFFLLTRSDPFVHRMGQLVTVGCEVSLHNPSIHRCGARLLASLPSHLHHARSPRHGSF